jgi:biofilm protein TabA
MILDHLSRAAGYRNLSPHFAVAFDFLLATDFNRLADGRHEVSGEDVFALLQTNPLKPATACRWEAHRTYADIQMVLVGRESIGRADLRHFEVESPYDPGRDVAFFVLRVGSAPDDFSVHPLGPGDFAMFLPQDVHMPLILPSGQLGAAHSQSRKVVMKVRVS